MKYKIQSGNWTISLAETIEKSNDGDTIIVLSEEMAELGELARIRMCPEKALTFEVEKES